MLAQNISSPYLFSSSHLISPSSSSLSLHDLSPNADSPPKSSQLQAIRNGLLKKLGCQSHDTFLAKSAFSLYDCTSDKKLVVQSEDGHSHEEDNEDVSAIEGQISKSKALKDKKEQYRLQTKNLNRFFRSKINEMLRDTIASSCDPQEVKKASDLLHRLNLSNKIMFSEMREIIKDEWLQQRLNRCTALLMRYVHCGKMGMQSKLIMLKYFNKILKAIKNPELFTCWK